MPQQRDGLVAVKHPECDEEDQREEVPVKERHPIPKVEP
jgi:hypothetical protein